MRTFAIPILNMMLLCLQSIHAANICHYWSLLFSVNQNESINFQSMVLCKALVS